MKKIISLLLAILLVFSFSACTNNAVEDEENVTSSPITTVSYASEDFVPFECTAEQFIYRDEHQRISINDGYIICNTEIYYEKQGMDRINLLSPDYETVACAFIDGALFYRDISNNILYRMVINFGDTVTAQKPTVVYNGFAVPERFYKGEIVLKTADSYLSLDTQTGEVMDYLDSKVTDAYSKNVKISSKEAVKIATKYIEQRGIDKEISEGKEYDLTFDYLRSDFLLFPDFSNSYGRFEQFDKGIPDYLWEIGFYWGDEDWAYGWRFVYVDAENGDLIGTSRYLAD